MTLAFVGVLLLALAVCGILLDTFFLFEEPWLTVMAGAGMVGTVLVIVGMLTS